MLLPKAKPVASANNLRKKVDRLLKEPLKKINIKNQLSLNLSTSINLEEKKNYPNQSIGKFINFISDSMPDGDVYLFGGVLRDLALLGQKGFNSDIDLVVDGNWSNFVPYLESLNATKNNFGGFRLLIKGWPVDIWNAEETWAIKEKIVEYKGVSSLTETTILNWDAILMNWRTKKFICRDNYFFEINERILDIVLENNPNPLGMLIRVFRHLCLKDARKITPSAANYLAVSSKKYNFEQIKKAELKSYGNNIIVHPYYKFFEELDIASNKSLHHQFSVASNIIAQELDLNYSE